MHIYLKWILWGIFDIFFHLITKMNFFLFFKLRDSKALLTWSKYPKNPTKLENLMHINPKWVLWGIFTFFSSNYIDKFLFFFFFFFHFFIFSNFIMQKPTYAPMVQILYQSNKIIKIYANLCKTKFMGNFWHSFI